MLQILLSVRGKILLSIGLLTILIVVTLWVFIDSLQGAANQAHVIDTAGEIRTASINIDLLSQEITATSTNNQNVVLAIESVLKDDTQFIDSITRFLNGKQPVLRNEFAAYMPFLNEEFRSNRIEFPEILAAVYAPLISRENREAFETSVASEGFQNFHILELGNAKEPVSAQVRDKYFPANFIVPFDVNRATSFGIDLGSNAQIQAILDQAGDSGNPLILSNTPFKLSHSEQDDTFWIVAPVYTTKTPATVADRQAQLQGYIILSIDGEALVQAATARLVQRSVILQIVDTGAPANSKPIFINSRLNLATTSGLITVSAPLDILGRKWNVTLAQVIDMEASITKLSETASTLNQRIALLETRITALIDPKSADPSNTALIDELTKIAERNKTLQKNIGIFLKSNSNSSREGLLPALQNNALAVFQSSTNFVDRLEQALELRVEQAIQTSGVVAGLALIIITVGFLMVRQILQNLSRLNRAALILAEGHLDERVEVTTQDEIGHIAISMNLMATQLQELINTLEQRVADRTHDLEIARKHAEQVNDAKSVFLSNMSHELRTPLNVIIGYANLMLTTPQMFDHISVSSVHRPYIELIEENGHYVVSLINDILDLSKIEAGKLELHCSSVDLVSVMRNVVIAVSGLLKDKPIQIRQEFDDTLPCVWADPIRTRQICLNLLSNAIKFTSAGSITLRAYIEGAFVRVSVIDTGIGISERDLNTIFNRFEQAGHDTDKYYGGTGLGLDISKGLCLMQGGELTARSTLRQGSTFSFIVPISKMDKRASLTISHFNEDGIEIFAHKSPVDDIALILLIEGDRSLCEGVHRTLENDGHVVIVAKDIDEIDKLAIGLLPTLIILDTELPNQISWQLLTQLKATLDTQAITVIVCTNGENSERARGLGAVVLLQKPTTAESIRDAVNNILSHKTASSDERYNTFSGVSDDYGLHITH